MKNPGPPCNICLIPEADIIARTAFSKAFFPTSSIAAAHIVVAVREHRPYLHDLTDGEAADLSVLARRIAAAARVPAGVEKFYSAAIGDVDLHYHLHLLPREPNTQGLGPFIFGPQGWAGQRLTAESDVEGFRTRIRRSLRELDFNDPRA
jgi:diadenosine tetraphosphate (Ap4A) HIT family hydrolase